VISNPNPQCRYLRLAATLVLLLALFPGSSPDVAVAAAGSEEFDFLIGDRGPVTATRAAALQQERAALKQARDHQQAAQRDLDARTAALKPDQVSQAMVERAAVKAETLQVQLDDLRLRYGSLSNDIEAVQKELAEMRAKQQLLENPASEVVAGADRETELRRLRTSTADQTEVLEWYKAREVITRERIEILEQQLKLAMRWQSALRKVAGETSGQRRSEVRSVVVDQRAEQESAAQLLGAEAIRKRLFSPGLPEHERRLLETRAEVAEEQAAVIRADGRIAEVNQQLTLIAQLLDSEQPTTGELKVAVRDVRELIGEIERGSGIFQRWIAVNQKRRALAERRTALGEEERQAIAEEVELLDRVRAELSSRSLQVEDALSRARTLALSLESAYEDAVRRGLLTRRTLPASGTELLYLLGRVAQTPPLIVNQVWVSVQFMANDLAGLDPGTWLLLAALELALVWMVMRLRRWLQRHKRLFHILIRRRDRFSDKIVLLLIRLLRNVSLPAAVVAAVVIAVELTGLQQPGRGILYTVLGIALLARLLGRLGWLLMADPQLADEFCHPGLYRVLQALIWLGALIVGVGMLARSTGVSESVQDVLDRMFMLFLMFTVLPALRVRRIVMAMLTDAYGSQFWFVSVRLLSLVVVWFPVVIAVLGFVGYLDLAWRLLGVLTLFAVAIVVWLLLRALLDDLVVFLKNKAVAHARFGLLWTQDIIAPLHRVARVLLFLAVIYQLLRVYGGGIVGVLADGVLDFLEIDLFTLGNSAISIWDILILLVSLLMVIRLGQWVRSITYSWVYSRIADLGIRNSLSAFTQYALVLIGLLIILNSVGIDLTAFTVFAGALGVGLGIGLQNVANNFVSGILLLVERPLKTGDWVQVVGGEGEVSSIGMRSLTVKTWDNQEVIIPNSEVISNSFTNWTRSDNVVRTVLYISVSREADPHQVRGLLQEVLDGHGQILEEPPAETFLWEFGESSVNFRIQYYCNVIRHSRLSIQSEVLFGIWDTLREHGVEIPYPQRDLHLKDVPADGARHYADRDPPKE
jgi:potassium efflux system protein